MVSGEEPKKPRLSPHQRGARCFFENQRSIMGKLVGNKNVGLLRSVEERAQHKKEEDEQKKQQVPYFHRDSLSNILLRLPLGSLHHARFVCKPWYNLINSPFFIDTHLRRSESVLVFLKPVPRQGSYNYSSTPITTEQPNTFSVEGSFLQSLPVPIFDQPKTNRESTYYVQFIEFGEGKSKIGEYKMSCRGNIRATCNGLILLDNKLKKGGLIVMNPVTRKIAAQPLGTLFPPERESYGFAVNDVNGEYKVVHLFQDNSGYVSCETLVLGNRSWRAVDGPSLGLFGWLGYPPISAIGGLHWIPQVDRSDYLVSMEVHGEKFHTIQLPKSCRVHDKIIEMGGSLCFVFHEGLNIDIWSLKCLSGDAWKKQYSITRGCIIDMVPLLSLRVSGDLIFKRNEDGSFYAYDVKLQEMRKIESHNGHFLRAGPYLPHVNSLVSWTRSEGICD
uniref:Uncharacterized protein n=1 Tax=Rhizophora mucronata TaxID=61149 RepID=A0A2P2Q4F5_RHIMU